MKLLQLLLKVAFICNICFLFTSFVQWLPNPPEGELVSMMIVMGYVLSILVNLFVHGWLGVLVISGRWNKVEAPKWLLTVNLLFFVVQLILIITHIVR